MTDPMTKAMFGQHAVHCGFNMIVQDGENGQAIIVAQSQTVGVHPLRFGSQRTHVLALGDMVFRPHLVMATDALRGRGLSGIVRDGFVDYESWIEQGDLVLDPIGRFTDAKSQMR